MRVGTARTEDDDSAKDELAAVQAALAAEHAAVYGYGVVGGRIGGERRKEAQAAYDGHRARRDALHRAVRDLGGKPKASAAAYELPFPVPDAAAAARLAAELEDRLAAVYADLVRAGGTARRAEAASALREAAVRSVRWRGSGVAFPGLGERAQAGLPTGSASASSNAL
ncbi:ferritin-like domain-containing protein [Streptomyces sp. Pv4-95]|uniref:ferritin-like domain-containing protein n=1 Tax=Streptomyces sp. Pv4-95 TaxID=3049543 RepID=UPI00389290DC